MARRGGRAHGFAARCTAGDCHDSCSRSRAVAQRGLDPMRLPAECMTRASCPAQYLLCCENVLSLKPGRPPWAFLAALRWWIDASDGSGHDAAPVGHRREAVDKEYKRPKKVAGWPFLVTSPRKRAQATQMMAEQAARVARGEVAPVSRRTAAVTRLRRTQATGQRPMTRP